MPLALLTPNGHSGIRILKLQSIKKQPSRAAFLLAGHVAQFWNTIEPSLLRMYEKLAELGFSNENGSVTYIEVLPEEVRDVRPL